MYFKKHISIVIAFLVLISNSGLAFNVHYCKGEIASVTSVFSNEDECEMSFTADYCCNASIVSHLKCCSDKEVTLKNQTEKFIEKNSKLQFEPVYFPEHRPLIFTTIQVIEVGSENHAFYCKSNAPPRYKLYCQYIFYA